MANEKFSAAPGPIGIFDSGYGGLTIFDKIRSLMPDYDYVYLGDNARAPYGPRSFEIVYEFTREAVKWLFHSGCQLVILACNTASAKALRSIQQNDLPDWDPQRRVLGVIRPTVEVVDQLSRTKHVGVLGTAGTIASHSYELEIGKLFPNIRVTGKACPMWVPLVEYNEYASDGADYFIQKYINELMAMDPKIDTIILGCTHYPLLMNKIRKYLPEGVNMFSQGEYVATSLVDYLKRHSDLESRLTRGGRQFFFTTESAEKFSSTASVFLSNPIHVQQVTLD
jgi:glutamate racemase